jgi:hypothetical protein
MLSQVAVTSICWSMVISVQSTSASTTDPVAELHLGALDRALKQTAEVDLAPIFGTESTG